MQFLVAIKRWLVAIVPIIGFGGLVYEVFWQGGSNVPLLRFFGGLLLSGAGAAIDWRSILRGFHFRIEVRDPEATIPTLLIDLGTLENKPLQPLSLSSPAENLKKEEPPV